MVRAPFEPERSVEGQTGGLAHQPLGVEQGGAVSDLVGERRRRLVGRRADRADELDAFRRLERGIEARAPVGAMGST